MIRFQALSGGFHRHLKRYISNTRFQDLGPVFHAHGLLDRSDTKHMVRYSIYISKKLYLAADFRL